LQSGNKVIVQFDGFGDDSDVVFEARCVEGIADTDRLARFRGLRGHDRSGCGQDRR